MNNITVLHLQTLNGFLTWIVIIENTLEKAGFDIPSDSTMILTI